MISARKSLRISVKTFAPPDFNSAPPISRSWRCPCIEILSKKGKGHIILTLLFQHHQIIAKRATMPFFLAYLHLFLHCFDFCNCKQVLLADYLFQVTLRTILCYYVTFTYCCWLVLRVLVALSFEFLVVDQTARILLCILRI